MARRALLSPLCCALGFLAPVRRLPGLARRDAGAALSMTVTPAIAKARIATREEEIRRLERELAAARAAVLSDRRELAALEIAPAGAAVLSFRETTSRSLVKAFGWRVTAGIVTFCSSMYGHVSDDARASDPRRRRYFTASLRTALAIVASDFLSKSGTMFVGERLFNRVKVGRSSEGESLSRSIAKALIWRCVAFVNTALVSGAIIGSAGVGSLIALSDSVFKTTLMVGYDQFWNQIDWGKELEGVDGDGI